MKTIPKVSFATVITVEEIKREKESQFINNKQNVEWLGKPNENV